MKKNAFVLACALCAAILPGCSSSQGLARFTVATVSNVDLSRMSEFIRAHDELSGTESKVSVMFLTVKKMDDFALERAIKDSLQKIPGAVAVVDAEVKRTDFHIPFIFGSLFRKETYVVKGQVLIDPKMQTTQEYLQDRKGRQGPVSMAEDEYFFVSDGAEVSLVTKGDFERLLQ